MLAPHERYLYKPFFGSSHHWALGKVAKLERLGDLKKDSRVLDIGSGSGAMGRELGNLGFKSIEAIEINEDARNNTKSYYSSIFTNIEEVLTIKNRYNLIFLLDIIEHLSDPQNYLGKVLDLAEDDATILISVPNITHWSIRLSILFGQFDYTERGILDRTHLHFFTKKHLQEMIAKVGDRSSSSLKLLELIGSIVPLEFILPKKIYDTQFFRFFSKIRLFAANHFTGLCAYQLLAEVKKTR
jgi:2-polyprenyl-3-methyl-5-hydroxy-6-metoxy-1,4-benzoquinol methylase